MFKPLAQIFSVTLIALAATAVQAAQSDPLTGLPLYPGMYFANKNSQNVCGTMVSTSTYSPSNGKLAALEAWFAGHLNGFKLVHGTVRHYPYDAFINADSTLSVSILGSDTKNGVDGVLYHRNAKPASTEKTEDLTNWFDGGDPLCR